MYLLLSLHLPPFCHLFPGFFIIFKFILKRLRKGPN